MFELTRKAVLVHRADHYHPAEAETCMRFLRAAPTTDRDDVLPWTRFRTNGRAIIDHSGHTMPLHMAAAWAGRTAQRGYSVDVAGNAGARLRGRVPEASLFTYRQSVYFDDLDALQMLHNARYAVYVERATTAFYESLGKVWEQDVADNPDQFHVVREIHVEFLAPFRGTGELRVDLSLEHMGATSCTYGFRCTSGAADVVHARGRRTIVRLDPVSFRPAPWTDWFRTAHMQLVESDGGES